MLGLFVISCSRVETNYPSLFIDNSNEVKFAASNTHFSNANSLINISIPSNDDLFEEAVQQLIEGV